MWKTLTPFDDVVLRDNPEQLEWDISSVKNVLKKASFFLMIFHPIPPIDGSAFFQPQTVLAPRSESWARNILTFLEASKFQKSHLFKWRWTKKLHQQKLQWQDLAK